MEQLEPRIAALRQTVMAHDGHNVVSAAFVQEVDRLLSAFYDDIGEIVRVDLKSLFTLFLLKVLYVNRGGKDASVLDYLAAMLARFLFTRELFPFQQGGKRLGYFMADLMEETSQRLVHFQNLFEAYRKFGDYSLFLTGIFPSSPRRWRRPGMLRKPGDFPRVDRPYYVTFGKRSYGKAAEHKLAEEIGQRATLIKLSRFFEVYMEALNEVSQHYILGFDMNLIADKMLDNFNRYRATGDPRYLDNARKYAALLKVDRDSFPKLFALRRGRRSPSS